MDGDLMDEYREVEEHIIVAQRDSKLTVKAMKSLLPSAAMHLWKFALSFFTCLKKTKLSVTRQGRSSLRGTAGVCAIHRSS